MLLQLMEKKKGKQTTKKKKEKKKRLFLSELHSAQYTLILWFLTIYSNPPTFEARMQKSHLPMQQHRLSKTEAQQKSPLSLSLECLRKPNVPLYNTNRRFQANGRVGCALEMVLASPLPILLG